MAVFLHFGKEISDMMVKHISIEVTSKQTKKPVFGGPADLTAYILEPVDGILDKKRPAVLLCPGGDTVHFLPEKTAHRYEVSGCWFSCF